MKYLIFLMIIAFASICYAADVEVPQSCIPKLYDYYSTIWNSQEAYQMYMILRGAIIEEGKTTINVNGVKISTCGQGDINIPFDKLQQWQLDTNGEYRYLPKITEFVYKLLRNGKASIQLEDDQPAISVEIIEDK